MRRKLKKVPKRILIFTTIFALLFAYYVTIPNIDALGEEYCLSAELEFEDGFSMDNISSVKVNGESWTSTSDRFTASPDEHNVLWTIEVIAGMNGDLYPQILTPGGSDSYLTYTAVPNPDNTDAPDDDFILTLTYNDSWSGKGDGEACGFAGVRITQGPPPEVPTHNVTGNVNINIIGSELEYHYDSEHPDNADVTYFKFDINGGTGEGQGDENLVPFRFGNAEYHYNSGEPPKNVDSVNTINPIEYTYRYDDSGYVTFCVNGGGTDEYTSIKINNVEYSQYAPHTQQDYWEHYDGYAQMFCIPNVPYSENYSVEVHGEQTSDDNKVPSFGWSYLSADRSEGVSPEEEGNFAHGRLEFVSARITIDNEELVFDNVNSFNNYRYHNLEHGAILHFAAGNKEYPEEDRRLAWGEAHMPFGTTLRVRIVPDEGYQLTGLAVSANGFQATETPGEYEVTINRTNLSYSEDLNQFDLNPTFTEVGATASSDSSNVSNVQITIAGGDNAFQAGTPQLEVTDVQSMSPERLDEFESAAEDAGYTINNYLEIDLYNTLYKGGKMDGNEYDAWKTQVHSLDNDATVVLELDQVLEGSEVALVHEVRNDENQIVGYDVVEGTYDANANTLTFETDGFSTFAIMYKGDAPVVTNTHTVTIREYDGTEITHFEVEHDGLIPADKQEPLADPDEHTHFGGYYTTDEYDTTFDFANTHITEDTSIYVLWHGESGTSDIEVSFDSQGGDPVEPQYVQPGDLATIPDPEPTNGDMVFGGWYLGDEPYDFNTPVNEPIVLVARWEEPERQRDQKYTATAGDNSITFMEESGHTFRLEIGDLLALTDEELSQAGITREQYNAIYKQIEDAAKKYGDVLAFYDINVYDENDNAIHEGPFEIKIKVSGDIKKYNTFKIMYVKDDFTLGEVKNLTLKDGYLVGTIDHLSNYLITGSVTTNPDTGDSINIWIAMLVLSGIGLSAVVLSTKKHKKIEVK